MAMDSRYVGFTPVPCTLQELTGSHVVSRAQGPQLQIHVLLALVRVMIEAQAELQTCW